jgi:hypothetical protein
MVQRLFRKIAKELAKRLRAMERMAAGKLFDLGLELIPI